MKIGVIGSVAANLWITGAGHKSPNDLDIVATYEDLTEFVKTIKADGVKVLAQYPIAAGKKIYIKTNVGVIEADIAWPDSPAERLLNLIQSETGTGLYWHGVTLMAPQLDVLYMLKMSHRYLKNSPHFFKTMQDIQLMRGLGCKIRPEHQEFYEQRMRDTYVYKHPKLDVDKKAFFTDDVPYVYDHDSIHTAVKHLRYPAYWYFKPANSEVAVSREMFEKLDEQTKLYSVLEEAYVLALERSQIPFPQTDKKKSFDMALMKVCSSITSGWWREYAWENYDKVQALYDENYTTKFWAAVEQGDVKLHNKEK